ncbi:efflux RND transporter permease subunit [Chitinimonas arctica]|uniref:Efflux RND transporter permease subunit n=1 Tax=Chitinimonas arctica TaxID=2594795 RepID=A0A516SBC2_9NEIS|nr:efflux RND transporter permease subunit [Chitinimonas arctica]QDQ25368.1 efflux RND transporter permease subunit [Chitinimonas arctica]
MWFTRISIQNPVFATMMMVALVVLGLVAYFRLPVEEMPDVKFPFVIVGATYPGASPEIVETEISRPLEEKLSTLSGIKHITADSYNGQSIVFVEFELSTDIDKALRDVREKVDEAKVDFRKEIDEPFITQARNDDSPTISVAVTSDKLSLRDMTIRTDQYIQRQFQTLKGVGSAQLVGGVKRQVRVEVQPERMHALGVGTDQVIAALRSENREVPIGNIAFDKTERIVQLKGRVAEANDFRQLVVARRAGQPITLGQVATVVDGAEEEESLSLVNGQRSISLDIRKVDGANTIEVTDGVKEMVKKLDKELKAEGMSLTVVGDSSRGIRRSLQEVKTTIFEGAALTILIVWLFLGSWRSTVITGLTLPVALIGTFFFLQAFGFTLNVMTLMALSLCVGLVIDDAIVVRENIVRHAEMGKGHYQASLDGTQEIGLAVLATTLTIVAVFLPVGFMGGIIGKFFFQFGIAVCAAVLISMLVSFTLDPMLSSIWHDPHAHGMRHTGPLGRILDGFERWMDRVSNTYGRVIEWALGHRKTTLAIAFATLIAAFAIPAAGLVGAEFIPKADTGRIFVDFRTPIGTSLDYTTIKARQVEAALREFKAIDEIYTTVNTGDSGGKHIGTTTIKLVDRDLRIPQDELIPKVRERLERIAGVEIRGVRGPDGGGGGPAVAIQIQGKELGELRRIAENISERLKRVKGLTDVQTSLRAAKPSVDIEVNRELASAVGLSVGQVGESLRPLVAGDKVTTWKSPDGDNYDVVVRLPRSDRRIVEDLGKLPIASGDLDPRTGQPAMIPLSHIASVKESGTSTLIQRRDLYRNVTITAEVQGMPVGAVQPDVKKVLDSIQMPPGYHYVQEGANEFMNESAGYAGIAILTGAIFIYLVLASQFGSFSQPLAIMVSLPLSLIGVMLALMAWGSTLNLFSVIGVIMLMGLVTKNAILLIDFVNRLRRDGVPRYEAIVEAGRVRLRPILMTTFAMIGGMLPLALSMGEGSETRAPMAHAIIGGVVTSTLLTLVVVPVVFTYLDDFGAWFLRLFSKHPMDDKAALEAAPQASSGR